MDFLNLLVAPVLEILKCSIPPLKRKIGYFLHYKKDVETLARKVKDLENTRTDVQHRVDLARKKLESIRKVVEAWVEKVDKVTIGNEGSRVNGESLEMIDNNRCFDGWCKCLSVPYNLGREVRKKMIIVDDLLNEGQSFHEVSDPSPPLEVEFMPMNGGFEAFASREYATKQVMEGLKDEETNVIGVYGMGGVGKTMLMNRICQQVKEENLFDLILTTTVSQNVDLNRIHGEFATTLGLQLQYGEVNDVYTRAAMIRARLKQEERILIILDDLWTSLDLYNLVGVPHEDNHPKAKGCKTIITTRSLDVCNLMTIKTFVEVGVLSKEESWHLFKKNTGEVVDSSPALKTVAMEVAIECGGLPIALVTLGRALRNKEDKLLWVDTALQLKRSNFTYIEGMNSKVFSSIKLSYDYLGNEMTRKCFLFCCLYPEDYKISMEELMMHIIGDDQLLDDVDTLKQARGRLHTVLEKLVSSCLLLGDKHGYVWMHDIIRDVAISIASSEEEEVKGKGGFIVKAGVSLRQWPERGRLLSGKKCSRMSLMRNEINLLPNEPDLPQLLTLLLEGNDSLVRIPDSFFGMMKALVTLDLRRTGISSLPTSLSGLVNLRTLCLDGCPFEVTDVSLIGKLEKLELLSLENCGLQSLPVELSGLSNLKLLNLTYNPNLSTIPMNVISNLSRLEELYASGGFSGWEAEGRGNGSNASLSELASLTCLTALCIEVHNHDIMLNITMGRHVGNRHIAAVDTEYHSDCTLTISPPICSSVKLLLQNVESLILRDCVGLESVGELDAGGFNKLKSLQVGECHEMEYLMSAVEDKIPKTALTRLEKLCISSMYNLKSFFHGPLPSGFLNQLKLLEVKKCYDLVNIFSADLFLRLPNLEVLRVEKCGRLKDVFHFEEMQSVSDERPKTVTFSRLREMYLRNHLQLMNIWKWKGVIQLGCFQNLLVMEVEGCDELTYLFSPDIACRLQHLELLKICGCKKMVQVISSSSEEMVEDRVTVDLANTTSTTRSRSTQTFPKLRELIVEKCDSLKHILSLGIPTHGGDLSQLQYIEVNECKSLEEIFNVDRVGLHHTTMIFPRLSELRLFGLPKLSTVLRGSSILSWPSLEVLAVCDDCENFRNLPLTHQSAPKLRLICGDNEQWFHSLEWEDQIVKLQLQLLFKAMKWVRSWSEEKKAWIRIPK